MFNSPPPHLVTACLTFTCSLQHHSVLVCSVNLLLRLVKKGYSGVFWDYLSLSLVPFLSCFCVSLPTLWCPSLSHPCFDQHEEDQVDVDNVFHSDGSYIDKDDEVCEVLDNKDTVSFAQREREKEREGCMCVCVWERERKLQCCKFRCRTCILKITWCLFCTSTGNCLLYNIMQSLRVFLASFLF